MVVLFVLGMVCSSFAMTPAFECAKAKALREGSSHDGWYTWHSPNGAGTIMYKPERSGTLITLGDLNTNDSVWYYEGNEYVGYNKDRTVNGKSIHSRPIHISDTEAENMARVFLRAMGVSCR